MNKEDFIQLVTNINTYKELLSIKESELWNEIKDNIEQYSLFESKLYYLYKKEKKENEINSKGIKKSFKKYTR